MREITSLDELGQLRPRERAALADYLGRLAVEYGERVQRVILFGSRARGEGDEESDVDVLVVLNDGDWRFHDAVAQASYEPSIQNNVLIAPLTMNAADFSWHAQHQAPLYQFVEKEGIDLWTRRFGLS